MCAFRSLQLDGTGILSATQNLLSWIAASGRRGYWQVGEEDCQVGNQTGLLQGSIRPTPGLVLTHRKGAEIPPRAGINVRPKLVRSCWSVTVTGKSLRMTETEREAWGVAQGSLLLVSPQQEISPSRSIQQGAVPEAQGHILSKILLVWHSVILTLVQGRCPFVQSPEMLQSGFKSSSLHRPKNLIVRQWIDSWDDKVSTQSRIY
jgi:hypothetical protein